MLITEELILKGMSGCGGWTRAQLKLLGVSWPPLRGWKERVCGKEIPDADAAKFISLRGVTKRSLRAARGEELMASVPVRLLKDVASVYSDLLEGAMLETAIQNDGRVPEKVWGGEIAILSELSSHIPKEKTDEDR